MQAAEVVVDILLVVELVVQVVQEEVERVALVLEEHQER
jgi:hypothetical protein